MGRFIVHYFRQGYDSDWTDEEVDLEFQEPDDEYNNREICNYLQAEEGFFDTQWITKKFDANRLKTIRARHPRSSPRKVYIPKFESDSESEEENDDIHIDFALCSAARKGDLATVQFTLGEGADVHANWDQSLRRAARNGHTKTVQLLLQAGADLETDNYYALRSAAKKGYTETVELLLQAGSDVHICDEYPLRRAARNGHAETVQVLLRAGANCETAFRRAASKGQIKIIQAMLLAGADSSSLSFSDLKKCLSPRFFLSLSDSEEILVGIESSHPEIRDKEWRKSRFDLKIWKEDNVFDFKISLAELCYRPGSATYYQAVDC